MALLFMTLSATLRPTVCCLVVQLARSQSSIRVNSDQTKRLGTSIAHRDSWSIALQEHRPNAGASLYCLPFQYHVNAKFCPDGLMEEGLFWERDEMTNRFGSYVTKHSQIFANERYEFLFYAGSLLIWSSVNC